MPNILTMDRRTFLRGAGALIALPFLESVQASPLRAENHPTRICFLYVPNGMYIPDWKPQRVGSLTPERLPATLRPLADLRRYMTVVSGLDNKVSEKTGRPEALGQHARSIGAYLSAAYPDPSLQAGTSIDVVLSQRLSARTRVPLLNLGTEYAEGEKDVGYSEVFNYSLSWKDARTPIQPIISPRMVFERLCGDLKKPGSSDGDRERLRMERGSVLDAVLDSSRQLLSQVSRNDGQVIQEYLDNLREIEQELSAPKFADTPTACAANRELDDEPDSFEDRLRIMFDLAHMALRANLTNVATLMLGAERSERDFGFLTGRAGFDMSGGHHSISHHKNHKKNIRRYTEINTFHCQQLARFLRKLRDTAEGEGNLLDHTLVVYGASMADGNSHEHGDVPLLLAGKGNGLLDPGKDGCHVDYGRKPLANLYLTLLEKLAITDSAGDLYTAFGDSGGTLSLPGGH